MVRLAGSEIAKDGELPIIFGFAIFIFSLKNFGLKRRRQM